MMSSDSAESTAQSNILAGLASLRHVREINVLLALIVVGALISFASPYFLSTNNLMGVFRAFSLTAIMSIGMVMVIITGGSTFRWARPWA